MIRIGFCLVLLPFWVGAQNTVEHLTIEPNHSTIGFSVAIAGGMTRVTGKFTESDLFLDYVNKDLTRSTVVFSIKSASIDTNLKDRDDHLRTADFFDVANFPEITFRSKGIRKKGKRFNLEGTLIMHGVQKQVVLPLKVMGEDKATLAIQITTKINRKDYGIGNNFHHTIMANFLPDDIDIEINLWTKRDKRKD